MTMVESPGIGGVESAEDAMAEQSRADNAVLLSGHGIDKFFGQGRTRKQVLHGVSVDVMAGECLAVIGGSGSGKSTLTRILLGLETADAGEVMYRGQPVCGETTGADASLVRRGGLRRQGSQGRTAKTAKAAKMTKAAKALTMSGIRRLPGFQALRRESGLVFQDPFGSLDPRWTVARSVGESLALRRESKPVVAERVAAALRTVGLAPETFAGRYPGELSGGQAQRVAIARAIVGEPRVILADEPMSAIDVAARIQILEAFAAIRAARPDTALIVVSHDLGVVRHLADRILVLHNGRVVETGPTAQVLGSPQDDYTKRLIAAASL